jgi:Glyoxalase/Bleomycin resistance protein/Dioxygenase superfamily
MLSANANPLLRPAFQTAYVTTDMDRAIDVFKDRYGAGQYRRLDAHTYTSEAGAKMTLEIALGWVGDAMIELIRPIAQDVSIFMDWLPAQGFGLRLHHIGFRLHSLQEWQDMQAETNARGHRVALSMASPSSRTLYIDTAAELGHYVEYLYYSDVPNSNLSKIPQNVPGHTTQY